MAHASRTAPLVPTVAVKLSGQPIVAGMALWVTSVSVEDDLDAPSMFTLELISKQDDRGTTPWTDDPRLDLGVEVEISMGYGDDRDVLIVGLITALEPSFSIAGPPTLVVRGFDHRYRLNAARHTQGFTARTDADIAREVCKNAHVDVVATESNVEHTYVLQHNQTDFAFLQERAKPIQYEVAMRGKTVLFRPMANSAKDAVKLTFNDDLLEFRPRMSVVPMTQIRVFGWDEKKKEPITATATADNSGATMGGKTSAASLAEKVFGTAIENLMRAPVASQAEADQRSVGHFNTAQLDLIRGDGRLLGRTDVRAGSVISLDGLGTRFNGVYYVESATHHFSRRGGYFTDFRAKRNAS